jgi:hypothetical protein
MSYKLTIEGAGFSSSRAPDPKGEPFEVAAQLIEHSLDSRDVQSMPDSRPVILFRQEWYVPPRCRKQQLRDVEVARFTLGDFRNGHSSR